MQRSAFFVPDGIPASLPSGVRSALCTLVILLGFAAPAWAQSGNGQIMGQVLSAETGAPLPGARVQLADGSRSVVAGVEGRFQIDASPGGEVSLQADMLGYAPKTITGIAVSGGGLARVDVLLERQALDVEGFVVTAQQERGSQVNLLNEQRIATGVVNAISAERISRSPDGDAAAAVKRVSGVSVQDGKYVFVRGLGERYTNSSLNGARIPSADPERKTVPLDLFPSSLLQSVSTSKTFTPDQSGDFSGGSVDIRTPDFPSQRIFSFSASTGFQEGVTGTTLPTAPTAGGEWWAFGTSQRSIPAPARDFSGTVTRGPEVNEVVNSFRNVWSVRDDTGRLPTSLSGSMGGSSALMGGTLGYLGALTYSGGDEARLDQRRARVGTGNTEIDRYDGSEGASTVLWGGMANLSALWGSHTQLRLTNSYNRSAENRARREVGTDENTRSRVQIDRLTYIERTVRSHRVQGQHQLHPRHELDWSLTGSAVSRSEPDRSEFVTWLDPETPIWFKDFEGAVRSFGLLEEGSWEGNAAYAFTLGSDPASSSRIRVGVNHRRTDRDAWSDAFRIQPFFWSPDDPRWQGSPEEFFDGRYADAGDDIFLLSRELSGGSYEARDRLTAGYLMAEVPLGERLRLVGGIRAEGYALELDAENQLGQGFQVDPDYLDLLPSLSGTFQVSRDHQLRASATRTLARPEYREIAPIAYREVLGGEQVIGNADLGRTLIRNLDLRWEWYPQAGEVVSFGVFGKWFDDPIEQRFLARSGTNTRTFVNAESATNHGVELEVDRSLAWLSPTLAPLSFFGNVTLMRSRVRTGQEGDAERAMVGQAPYVLNSGLTWSAPSRATSATALYNVVGERIVNARASGSQVDDVLERPRHQLDLSLRFPLLAGASGKVDLSNLLDSPYEVVQGSTVREFHRTGRSLSAGISWQW